MSGVVAFVFARGGSKGLPGKNTRLLGGIPLIGRAIQACQASAHVDRVVVSTDDREIGDVARSFGADVPWMRPAELATDTVSEWLAWRHAADAVEQVDGPIDLFVSVPATAPLRVAGDIDRAIETYRSSDCDLVVTTTEAASNPYFDMMELDESGALVVVGRRAGSFTRRQDAPKVLELTPVAYVTRPSYIRSVDRIFAGRILGCEVPRERAVDIDVEEDFHYAEFLLARQRAGHQGDPGVT